MAQTKFGISQIVAETPKWATWTFRIVLYVCAATGVIVSSFSSIPQDVQLTILKACVEVTAATHGLTRLFGLSIPDDPSQNGTAQK